MIVRFIDENKDRFGVEPMCAQLADLGCTSPVHLLRRPSPAAVAARYPGRYLMELIQKAYDENYSCYGARKIWLALRQDDHDVARCTVERLMRVLGLRGASRGKVKRTTIADPAAARAGDLVGATSPHRSACCGSLISRIYRRWPAGVCRVRYRCLCAAHSRMESLVIDDGQLVLAAAGEAIFTRNATESIASRTYTSQ